MKVMPGSRLIDPNWFALTFTLAIVIAFVSWNMVHGASQLKSAEIECKEFMQSMGLSDDEIRAKCEPKRIKSRRNKE